jgi:hypothetical protein
VFKLWCDFVFVFRAKISTHWCADYPDEASQWVRVVQTTYSWLFAKMHLYWRRWPRQLARLRDKRIPQHARDATLRAFLTVRCQHCLDQGMGRKMYMSLRDPKDTVPLSIERMEERFHAKYDLFLDQWPYTVPVTVADVEYIHNHNRQRAHPGMSWASFNAGFVNEESRLLRVSSLVRATQMKERALVRLSIYYIAMPRQFVMRTNNYSRFIPNIGVSFGPLQCFWCVCIWRT